MERELKVPLAWHWIAQVREEVRESLADCPPDIRESAVMVASELAENMVKYGEPTGEDAVGFVTVTNDGEAIRLKAANGLRSPTAAENLVRRLNKMKTSDPLDLYMQRLREMMQDPAVSGGLGLLRIAFEAKFTLSASYDAPLLTITAERRMG